MGLHFHLFMSILFLYIENIFLCFQHIMFSITTFTPLNNSIRTADEFSTKLPVTDLNIAPKKGAVSNLRRFRMHSVNHNNLGFRKTCKKTFFVEIQYSHHFENLSPFVCSLFE